MMELNLNQYSQIFGRPLTGEEIQGFQIHSLALGQLINNAVFENEFDTNNFIIDETVVASETKKRFPNLYNENNKIDELALNSFLSQQNLKIDDLVNIIDYEARSKIFDKLFFEVGYPDQMEQLLNKHNNHIRNIDLLKFNVNDFQLPNYNNLDISINNNLIKEYFEQNINSYMNPEKRNISYILIDKNDFKDQFIPSTTQIQNYYNNNKSLFLDTEKRDFIQFNFKNIIDASEFKRTISKFNKEEIVSFAKENNIIFNEFTKVAKNEVLEDLANAIFNLKENQVSEVVETPLAKHIVIINKIYPEYQKTLEQSLEEISNSLNDLETDSFFSELKIKISQQILDGFSLNEIANENSLTIETIKDAERLINQSDNDLIKNEVIAKGFTSNKDFISDIADIDENTSFVINVDQIYKEKPYELNEVFEKVSNDWIKSLKIASIENKIIEISENNKSINDIASFVLSAIINTDLKLNDINYPSSLINDVFENKINEISLSVVGEEVFISELKNITFPEEEENIQPISMLAELRGNFSAEKIKDKNISTNDSLIQALLSQYK